MTQSIQLGIDVGSTTVKIAALDHDNKIIYQNYMRHYSDLYTSVETIISDALKHIGDVDCHVEVVDAVKHFRNFELIAVLIAGSIHPGSFVDADRRHDKRRIVAPIADYLPFFRAFSHARAIISPISAALRALCDLCV